MLTDNQHNEKTSALILQLWEMVKQMGSLKIEDFKLMLSQKLTKLLGSVTFGAIALISAVAFITFTGLAITELIADLLPLWASYLVVAGIVVALVLIVFAMRRRLIYDPLARFISRLLFEQ